MTFEIFSVGLLGVSVTTGLATEAIKKVLQEHNKTYHANTLAGGVAVALSVLFGAGYAVFTGATVDAKLVVTLIALTGASWLASMIGYDKVVQAIAQFKNAK